jgi:prepilin-type N-terminal cleavage/methylation domain-containing protein
MSPPTQILPAPDHRDAFSLVELLVVIGVIGLLSALIITYITNATRESRLVIARQQQVVLQEALNAWIASTDSLGDARAAYSTNGGTMLSLLNPYLKNTLDTRTNAMFYEEAGSISSEILDKINRQLSFSPWDETNFPVIELQ